MNSTLNIEKIDSGSTLNEPRAGVVTRFLSSTRGRIGAVLVALTCFVVGGASVATAAPTVTDPTDPLNGGGDSIFTTLSGYLSGHLVAEVFGLAVIAIAIGLVLKWVRKAVHA